MTRTVKTVFSSVNRWECDENDHLNVQFYGKRFDEAARHFALTVPDSRPDMDLPRERHIRFHAELRVAVPYHVESAAIEDGPFAGSVVHFMRHTETGKLAATALDAAGGQKFSHTIKAEDCADALPRGIPEKTPTPLRAEEILQKGGLRSHRSVVWPADCDQQGLMTEQFHIGRSSDSMPHLWQHYGLTASWFKENHCGSAGVEMRVTRYRTARAGDAIEVHSNATRAGSRTILIRHEISMAASGEPVATIQVLSLMLDHRTRRAGSLPEQLARLPQADTAS